MSYDTVLRPPATRLLTVVATVAALLLAGLATPETANAATAPRALTATPTPHISGATTVGSTVKAAAGTWKPVPVKVKFAWKRNGQAIAHAGASTYKLSTADIGRKITVTTTGSRAGYKTVSRTSGAVIGVGVLTDQPVPTISGGARADQTLTAVAGSWAPAPVTLNYQWFSNGAAIPGATGSTFTPGVGQLGASITVSIAASKPGYTTVTKRSAGTAAVLGATQLNPGGELTAGQYLTSPSTQYELIMQTDGNLVEYGPSGAVWSTGTSGSNFVAMQTDGNLVIYRTTGGAIWSSNTSNGSPAVLALQDDSNVVVYQGSTPTWSRDVVGYGTVKPAGGTQGMSQPTLNSTQITTYPAGKILGFVCYASGETVTGYYGKGNLWHQLLGGNYVPDVDMNTGINGPLPGEPQCAGSAPSTSNLDAFVTKYNGKLDVTNIAGTYPGQCVSLVSRYLLEDFGITSGAWGNAVDYRAGGLGGNQLQTRSFNWHTDTAFQNGDILVYGEGPNHDPGINGHIGIWYNGRIFDQNDGRGARTYDPNTQTYSVGFASFFSSGYLGYWRHS